eukprot:365948-Chlamydomonas_euryale.AAC.5
MRASHQATTPKNHESTRRIVTLCLLCPATCITVFAVSLQARAYGRFRTLPNCVVLSYRARGATSRLLLHELLDLDLQAWTCGRAAALHWAMARNARTLTYRARRLHVIWSLFNMSCLTSQLCWNAKLSPRFESLIWGCPRI